MNNAFNRKLSRFLSALVCIALALSVFTALGSVVWARAQDDDDTYTPYTQEELSISNSNFASGSGSNYPRTPDSWTGGGVAGSGSATVVGGIMDLDTYTAHKDEYKLDADYPDQFKGVTPESPFGPASRYENTNRNVLMINVRPSNSQGTAYGYTSSSLSLTANHYYHIEAWVRTGKFDGTAGAAIRIDGLDDDVAFSQIDTTPADGQYTAANDYGWEQYHFYIATSAYGSGNITINLQVGDKYGEELYYPAVGYAFFDNVHAYQIAPDQYLGMLESVRSLGNREGENKYRSDNVLVVDYSAKTSEKFASVANLDFSQDLHDGWEFVLDDDTDLNDVRITRYDGFSLFDKDNDLHLKADPASAYGKYEPDSHILAISSYRDNFHSVSAGVASQTFMLERYRYYRISVWAKAELDTTDGSGATFALSVIRNENDKAYEGENLYSTITSCNGDAADKARAGFKQYSFYVKGSSLYDFPASVECRLGTHDGKSAGVALFDNVTIEEITPAVYTANSANGTVVNLDTDGSYITYPSTGVSNGEFYLIDTYETFEYPFKPEGWTMYTPDTTGTLGQSPEVAHLEKDDIISGVIPTDAATFEAYRDRFGAGARNPREGAGSVLMMYSSSPNAFCYRSSSFTVAADKAGKLTVSLWVDGSTGAGASLVLKNNDTILSTLENIHDTNGFKTFTFYIEPKSEEISTLSVEIWLGNSDRQNNTTKLAAGHVYVQRVAYADLGESESFATYKQAFDAERAMHNTQMAAAAYSFKTVDFSAYDYYDPAYIKYPYDWSLTVNGGESDMVRYGIFDTEHRNANDSSIPSHFEGDGKNSLVLVLHNPLPAASTLTHTGSFSFAADTYYKVDVTIKVDLPEQGKDAVGASIRLGDTKYVFKDIKTTVKTSGKDVIDAEAFQTYTFYIKAGSEASTASLSISLGDSAAASKRCSGYVYISDIAFTDITNVAYEVAETEIGKRDKDKEYDAAYTRALLADLSTATDDDTSDETPSEDTGSATLDWWLIPSILFAVAIVIAIVGFAVRKFLEKRAAKKSNVAKQASYDRARTLHREHNANADESEKVTVTDGDVSDEHYDALDDDAPVAPVAPVPVTDTVTEETPAPATEEADAPAEEADETPSDDATEPTDETPSDDAQKAEEKPEKKDAFLDQFDD